MGDSYRFRERCAGRGTTACILPSVGKGEMLTFKPFQGLSTMLEVHETAMCTQYELEAEHARDTPHVGVDPEFYTYKIEITGSDRKWSLRKIRR